MAMSGKYNILKKLLINALKEDIDSLENLKISCKLSQLLTIEAHMHFHIEKPFYWKVLKICLVHYSNTKV